MKSKTFEVKYREYNLNELSDSEKDLLLNADEATKKSYSPYSHFRVGAAILFEDGSIIRGNNQENAAYPSGLCAERVALFYASANYPDKKVISIAVTAKSKEIDIFEPVTPCGACRQVMLEYEEKQKDSISILLKGEGDTVYKLETVRSLLPLSFEGHQLKK